MGQSAAALPNWKSQPFNRGNSKNRLVQKFVNGECAVILGSEALLKKNDSNNQTGDSHVALLKRKYSDAEYVSDIQFWEKKGPVKPRTLQEVHDQWLNNEEIKVEDGLLQLLQCTKVVFTTAVDMVTWLAMQSAYEGKEVECYSLTDKSRIANLVSYLEKYEADPISSNPAVVYLLGNICQPENYFAYNEVTYARYILNVLSVVNEHTAIRNFFAKRCILSVGMGMDDWRFRFMWHAIGGGVMPTDAHVVLTTGLNSKMEDELQVETQGQSFVYTEKDSHKFLEGLKDVLTAEKVSEILIDRMKNVASLFVSYRSKDREKVDPFVIRLKKEFANVWYDYTSLLSGDKYYKRICEGIEECKVFVLVLSKTLVENLKKLDEELKRLGKQDNFTQDDLVRIYNDDREKCPFVIAVEWMLAKKKAVEWKQAKKEGTPIVYVHTQNYMPSGTHHDLFRKIMGIKEGEEDISILEISQIEEIIKSIDRVLNNAAK